MARYECAGYVSYDHLKPGEYEAREMKTCEHCGKQFVRPIRTAFSIALGREVRTGPKICLACRVPFAAPPPPDEYMQSATRLRPNHQNTRPKIVPFP